MAKKSIASLNTGTGKEYAKVITTVKSTRTGAYSFKAVVVHNDLVKEVLRGAQDKLA